MKNSLLNTKRRHSSHHNLPTNKEIKDFNRPYSFNMFSLAETDLFQGIYRGGKIVENPPKDNKFLSQKASLNIDILMKFKSDQMNKMVRPAKSSEQLQEQNLFLKVQANKLREQNCQLRGKLTLPKEKKSGLQNVCIDFTKDSYWSGNERNTRVIGMRLQYENLQQQLKEAKKELKKLKDEQVINGRKELEIYIKQLQRENKKLFEEVEYLKRSKQLVENGQVKRLQKDKEKKKQDQQREKIVRQLEKRNELQQRLRIQLNKKQTTLQFLQQLLKKKDNSEHKARRELRISKRQKQEAINKYQEMKEQLRVCNKKIEVQKIKFFSFFQSQMSKAKLEYERIIQQKIKEVKSLQQIISTIKLNKSNFHQQGINQFQTQNRNISSFIYQSIKIPNGQSRKLSVDDKNLFNLIKEESVEIESAYSKIYATFHHQDNSSIQLHENSSNGNKKQREPLRANQKHSQNARKLRKVQFNDIKDLGQLIRLRLIGARIQSYQLKQYFSHPKISSDQSQKSSESQSHASFFEAIDYSNKRKPTKDWEERYISMKEVVEILRKVPFCLTLNQAILLGRYLVQDCQIDYVYCDELNENTREIVGCIFKSLIGEYETISNEQAMNLHLRIEKYIPNLKKTLESLYPIQTIAKNKLFEVMGKTGIQIDERQKEIVTAIISRNSQSLNSLQYSGIFDI